jgi:hypothetical protein
MRSVVRVIGKVLRLVGISNPEDSVIKPFRCLRSTILGIEAGSAGTVWIANRNDAIVGVLLTSGPNSEMIGFEGDYVA